MPDANLYGLPPALLTPTEPNPELILATEGKPLPIPSDSGIDIICFDVML
jgi:hypothetical protein